MKETCFYDREGDDMVFSSFIFLWFFLPILFVLYQLVKTKAALRNAALALASLFFYGWGEPRYVLLLIALMVFNYICAVFMKKCSRNRRAERLVFLGASGLNIFLLCFFKYGSSVLLGNYYLPVGFSFFTFFNLSFFADLYLEKAPWPGDFLEYALYTSFFAKLMQGPIMKYSEFKRQTDRGRGISTLNQTAEGVRQFLWGLSKKVLIADMLGQYVNTMADLELVEMSSGILWCMVLFYTFQIYFDFSGYSDMALGLGKLFGYDFPENFHYPYLSGSIKEFWQRWHITLGAWFREYVYFPLGGSRKGRLRTCLNLMVVFLLSGAWHGNGINFILWGFYHGVLQVIESVGLNRFLKKHVVISRLYTFFAVAMGWLFFIVPDLNLIITYLKRMLFPWKYSYIQVPILQIIPFRGWFFFGVAVLSCGILQVAMKKLWPASEKLKNSYLEMTACSILALYSICTLAGATYQSFLYFKF